MGLNCSLSLKTGFLVVVLKYKIPVIYIVCHAIKITSDLAMEVDSILIVGFEFYLLE